MPSDVDASQVLEQENRSHNYGKCCAFSGSEVFLSFEGLAPSIGRTISERFADPSAQ